ncbi:MAG: diphosphate--fructose-6-phosphate 1-phosphotransferase, partial [Spirochaetes bacterium]|nr:diphosphate--fructose-6-phosphate 1-phosphotransferase [Spirochaetota bacterium]
YIDITDEYLAEFRNTGGFDIIGSGRTKLETEEQFETCAQVMKKLGVTSLVVIGGDDSNTNAALLAEYFKSKDISIQVIGVPKTIDGDLKTREIPISFGFDTACKVYSELVGNIARDSNSAKKYWHFIKLMGRSASHIALETALQTHPNICLIGEEVDKKQQTLDNIVGNIVDVILKRSNNGCDYGIALIPEGLIEFIPEMKALIAELNDILAENEKHFSTLSGFTEQSEFINHKLSRDTSYTFSSLPWDIQRQLLMDRDPHGNVQVSRIETEKLLIELVESKLKELKNKGEFKGKFSAQSHFFGYEGRCAAPSNFDADYTYSLGVAAVLLINAGLTGYMSSIQNLLSSSDDWIAGGIPVTMMMNLEQRHGKKKPVIRKALVELEGAPFKEFKARKKEWAINTRFRYPGPIQYFGPDGVCDAITITLKLEQENIN